MYSISLVKVKKIYTNKGVLSHEQVQSVKKFIITLVYCILEYGCVVFSLNFMSFSHDIFRKAMAIKMLLSNVKWKKRRKEFNSIQFLGSKSHKVGKTVLSNVSQSKA